MRRSALPSLLGAVLCLNLSVVCVRAGSIPTSTPGATATPTSLGKPKGSHVLDAMMRAWQAAGSEHFTWNYHWVNVNGSTTTILGGPQAGDIDWQHNPPIFQMQGPTYKTKKTSTSQSTTRAREIQLFDQNLLAIKIGKGKWTCGHFFSYASLPGSPLSDATSAYGLDAHNMGITMVNGVATWHVRVLQVSLPPKGKKTPRSVAVLDYYASTSTYLPLKIQTLSRYWTKTGHGTDESTLLLTNFGESVQVTLPPACKGI